MSRCRVGCRPDRNEVAKLINRSYRRWIDAMELDMDEVVNEVCLALLRRTFDPERSSRTHFIIIVARSVITDMGRAKRRNRMVPSDDTARSQLCFKLPTDRLELRDVLRRMADDVGAELVPVLIVLAEGGNTVDVSKKLGMPQPVARASVKEVRERLAHWVH